MDYSEKYGNSIDEAVTLALKDLKAEKEDVIVEVLEEPSRGFLGLGQKLAKVRVTLKKQEEPQQSVETAAAAAPEEAKAPAATETGEEAETETTSTVSAASFAPAAEEPDSSAESSAAFTESSDGADHAAAERRGGRSRSRRRGERRERRGRKPAKRVVVIKRPDDLVDVEDHKALDFLRSTTECMGLDLDFKAQQNAESFYVDISGRDAGTIIGKRGQTLDAIQYLTSLVVNKDSSKSIRVVLGFQTGRQGRSQRPLVQAGADEPVRTDGDPRDAAERRARDNPQRG